MTSRSKTFLRDGLWILGTLWPLVLLAPHVPGIPRPTISGLPWRQELVLSSLLTTALLILLVNGKGRQCCTAVLRNRSLVLLALSLLVTWQWISVTWATDSYQGIHLCLQWSCYLIFFALLSGAASARAIRSSFITLAIVIWVLAIACAIETLFGDFLGDANFRAGMKPLLRGSGGFGEITGSACILFAAFALHLKQHRAAWLCGATALAGWLATMQSLERAPLIGVVLGLSILCGGALLKTSKRQFVRTSCLVGGLVLMATVNHAISASREFNQSTFTRFNQSLKADANVSARLLYWGIGIEILRAHPLLGAGANNYQVNYPEGRANFSARYPDNPLVAINDSLLAVYAHNEYVQMLSEVGIIGFGLFIALCLTFAATLKRALKVRKRALPSMGAAGAMLAFGVSSAASASSFRYLGGGLTFFFAAALLCRFARSPQPDSRQARGFMQPNSRIVAVVGMACLALMTLSTCLFAGQLTGNVLQALADSNRDPRQQEQYYRAALRVYPGNPAAQFDYGFWLFRSGRAAESLSHLRYANERGFNSSISYQYLAAAEEAAGDRLAAETTLARAVRVYPQTLFLLVRHAVALGRVGRNFEAEVEFSKALLIDSRAARAWQQLIENDIDAAYSAARDDANIAKPGELTPEAAVFAILQENEGRFPGLVNTGWRHRIRSNHPH